MDVKKILILASMFTVIFLTVGCVFAENSGIAESNGTTYLVNQSSYGNYFDNSGNILLNSLKSGDTVNIQGDLVGKNMLINLPLNIISSDNSGRFLNGTIKIVLNGSNSNISGLKFANSNPNGYGVYLYNSNSNNIQNCQFTMQGEGGYGVTLVGSNYNTIKNNNLALLLSTAGGSGLDPRAASGIVLGNSNYNIIEGNTIATNGSNAIYLCNYGFADYIPSDGPSNYNIIRNNLLYGGVSSWCWNIKIMGHYNNVSSNRINGGDRGVSSEGKYNTIINNTINGSGTGIVGGESDNILFNTINNKILNNKISNYKGIDVLKGSTISNNTIFVENGYGIQVSAGTNVSLNENKINTTKGSGIIIYGASSDISISNNTINSLNGTGILLQKQSSLKFPKNISVKNNYISTSSEYGINAHDGDETFFESSNTLVGCNILLPSGEVQTPDNGFSGKIYNITEANFYDYFQISGSLRSDVINDGDILNFSGNFYNKDMYLQNRVKLTGNSPSFFNSSITISSEGVMVENFNISVEDKIPILIYNTNKVVISNNVLSVNHSTTAYAIYILLSDNNVIVNNRITAKGDLLTYAILLYGSNNNTIDNNNIKSIGTGIVYDYESEVCVDGEICIDGEQSINGAHVVPEIFRTYGILVLYSSDNKITNNLVNSSSSLNKSNPYYNSSGSSIVGIDIYYDSHNNFIDNNQIYLNANDKYLYGLGVLGAPTKIGTINASNNLFTNNLIRINSSYMGTGFISGFNSYNTLISKNDIEVKASNLAYGATFEISNQNSLINNTIKTSAIVNYVVEIFSSNDNSISGNIVEGAGNYSYGIALYDSSNNVLELNNISSFGSSKSNISIEFNHSDAIKEGNSGIFLMANSNKNLIEKNNITTFGDYAIDSLRNETGLNINNLISDNYLKSLNKNSNDAVNINSNNQVVNNYLNYYNVIFYPGTSDFNSNVTLRLNLSSSNNSISLINTTVKFYIFNNKTGNYDYIGENNSNNLGTVLFNWKIPNNLTVGIYQIISNISGEDFKNYTISSFLNLTKGELDLNLGNINTSRSTTTTVSAKAIDKNEDSISNIEVKFYLDGIYIGKNTTNSQGIAILKYKVPTTQSLGDHILNATSTESNNYFQSVSNKAILKVENPLKSAKFSFSLPSIYQGQSTKITATLKDSSGNGISGVNITISSGNLKKTLTTNSKGIVTFKYSKLKAGNHQFKASFLGNNEYSKVEISKTQIIYKKMADLVMVNVVKKGNKYTFKLKNQGVLSSGNFKIKLNLGSSSTIYTCPSIKAQKIISYTLAIGKKYLNLKKTIELNYNKKIKETTYTNNKKTFY